LGPVLFKQIFPKDGAFYLSETAFFSIHFGNAIMLYTNEQFVKEAFGKMTAKNDTLGIHVFRATFAFARLKSYSAKAALGLVFRDRCSPIFSAKVNNTDGQIPFTNFIERF
jgi:hypothetical protein